MKTINRYKIEIIVKKGIIGDVGSKFTHTVEDVLAMNNSRICINDITFTTVEIKKCDYRYSIDVPNINSYSNDKVFGTKLTYTLFTNKKKRKQTMAKEIRQYLDDKYGDWATIDLMFLEAA